MTSRFFAFGCSFTQYYWPTWADIIAHNGNYTDYINWGAPGGGNTFIQSSLSECSIKHNINADDLVIIHWSGACREDRWVNGSWVNYGSVTNGYSKEFIDNFTDPVGWFLRDCVNIHNAVTLLNAIGCEYYMLSMEPMYFTDGTVGDITKVYKLYLDQVRKSVCEVVFNNNWDSRRQELYSDVMPPEPLLQLKWFKASYDNKKGTSWPDFEDLLTTNLPSHLHDEIIISINEDTQTAITNLSELKNTMYSYKLVVNGHPTPLMWLEYVYKVLPEIVIIDQTVEWVIDKNANLFANDPGSRQLPCIEPITDRF